MEYKTQIHHTWRSKSLISILYLFSAVVLGFSQNESIENSEPNKAAEKLIQYIITPEYTEEIIRQASQQASLSFENSIKISLKRELTESEKNRLLLFWYKKVKEIINLDLMNQIFVPTITKHLTLNEINEINKFYESPIGKKLVQINPILSRESQALGERIGKKIADKEWIAKTLIELKSEFPQWYPESK